MRAANMLAFRIVTMGVALGYGLEGELIAAAAAAAPPPPASCKEGTIPKPQPCPSPAHKGR
eukprot:COSAG01_NODE_8343_length_2822_cov_4.117150_1_plen_60_part_10